MRLHSDHHVGEAKRRRRLVITAAIVLGAGMLIGGASAAPWGVPVGTNVVAAT